MYTEALRVKFATDGADSNVAGLPLFEPRVQLLLQGQHVQSSGRSAGDLQRVNIYSDNNIGRRCAWVCRYKKVMGL